MLDEASTNQKIACLEAPQSPASTAGNSTPPLSASSSLFQSALLDEVVEDVLIIGSSSWTLSLESSEDIARLSRCIWKAHEPFNSLGVSTEAIIAWKLFQAADVNYNGYVTSSDLRKVLVSLNPRLANMDQRLLAPFNDGDLNLTMLFWDALVWWNKMPISDPERRIVEHAIVSKLVVPSDGLWTGLSLSALLRVWKTVCRSAGYLFRYEAMKYLESAFSAVKSQEILENSYLAQVEVILYLIEESANALGRNAGKMWSEFCEQDSDFDGAISQEELDALLGKLNLRCVPAPTLPISRSTSGSSSLLGSQDLEQDGSDEKGSQYTLLQMLDAMLESSEIVVSSKTELCLAGKRGRSASSQSFTSKWNNFWRTIFKSSQRSGSRRTAVLLRLERKGPTRVKSALGSYVKMYLDMEQWRGQKLCELSALSSAPL